MRKAKNWKPSATVIAAFSALGVLGAACHFDALFGSGRKGGGGGGGGGGGLGPRWRLESLMQLRSDSTMIPTGGTTPEPSLVVRAVVHDTANGTLRLEVEVQPVGSAFVDQATDASDPTPSDTAAYVHVGGLADNASYHWQARVVDDTAASDWLPYGGNGENAADLRVALPVAANHLEFTQNPMTTTAGATMAPVRVTLKDGQGNTITSFTGNVHLEIDPNANPGGGTLGGASVDVNAAAGVATFSTLTITKAGSGYKLKATADGVAAVTSGSFGINADIAHHPKYLVPPSNTTPNRPITPAVKVAIMDKYDNVANGFTGKVFVALAKDGSPGGNATLEASGTQRAAAAGIVTFEDLKIDQLGVGYTISVSAVAVFDLESAPFNVLVSLPAPPRTGVTP